MNIYIYIYIYKQAEVQVPHCLREYDHGREKKKLRLAQGQQHYILVGSYVYCVRVRLVLCCFFFFYDLPWFLHSFKRCISFPYIFLRIKSRSSRQKEKKTKIMWVAKTLKIEHKEKTRSCRWLSFFFNHLCACRNSWVTFWKNDAQSLKISPSFVLAHAHTHTQTWLTSFVSTFINCLIQKKKVPLVVYYKRKSTDERVSTLFLVSKTQHRRTRKQKRKDDKTRNEKKSTY